MLVCVSSHNFAHETAGAARTRHSLLPLLRERPFPANLGQIMPRECESAFCLRMLNCHRPQKAGDPVRCGFSALSLAFLEYWADSTGQAGRRRGEGLFEVRSDLSLVFFSSKAKRAIQDRKSTRLNSSHQIISYAV